MNNMPLIINKQNLLTAKWLRLDLLHYVDRHGHERKWEAAQRVNSNGAVIMIAEKRTTGEIILIRQYRPPADNYVIEFPAGLIDDGENPEKTAVRELLEETGYHGTVTSISPPGLNSPGMTGEMVYTVSMKIDDTPSNHEPVSRQEESEDIETILVRKDKMACFLRNATEHDGCGVDAKVISYVIGLSESYTVAKKHLL